ncbi:hypothetical protein F5148DRAFT_1275852 [Russula earlei]|uniref:Uncharacterized protein n=1 Tax=Russula earlei TaxID=71964 RepID=A0ACC0UAV6_9AGAM|nr:hypothetical protein F5148DRAFT_1275852 [Russula earlei]
MASLPRTCRLAPFGMRGMPSMHMHTYTPRRPKDEGSIATVFSSLSGSAPALPTRFADLKKDLWIDLLSQSWREVLHELRGSVEEIVARGAEMIPSVHFSDLQRGLSLDQISQIRAAGVLIVRAGVPHEEALGWKRTLKDYISLNGDKVKGFPEGNLQVFEIYNSGAQIRARTHPAILQTQRAILQLWHCTESEAKLSLVTPISYFDRLRMRQPGDRSFTLIPHIDGGSLERWEDPGFRACFRSIFEGRWREHDPFDAAPRLDACQDLYHAPNQCSIFRPWQGWTSMSTTGPGEGTLRVAPMLKLATAYLILRPFFKPRTPFSGLDDWVVDLESTTFPGSQMGKTQELSEATHPHLQLSRTMVSAPRVEPGDQIYCDSSVLYIPAVPLSVRNAEYLRDQRHNFERGLPAPDFPGGKGESFFLSRGGQEHIQGRTGLRALGFKAFDIPAGASAGEAQAVLEANRILFPEIFE